MQLMERGEWKHVVPMLERVLNKSAGRGEAGSR